MHNLGNKFIENNSMKHTLLLISAFLSLNIFAQTSNLKVKTDTLGLGTYHTNEGVVFLNYNECLRIWQSYVRKNGGITEPMPNRTFVYSSSNIKFNAMGDLIFSAFYKYTPIADTACLVGIYTDESTGKNPAYTYFINAYESELNEAIAKRRSLIIKEEVKALEQDKKEAEKEVKQLNKDIGKKDNEIRKSEVKIDENQKEISDRTAEIGRNETEIKALEESIASFDSKGKKSSIKTLNKDAKKLLAANKKRNKTINKNVKKISKLEAEKAANEVTIEQIRKQAIETAKVDALKSEARKMEKKADKLERSNQKAVSKVNDMNIENADLQKAIDADAATAAAKKEQALALKTEIDRFDEKAKTKRIKSLNKSNKKLAKSKEKLASKNVDIKTDIKETKTEKESLEGVAEDKKSEVAAKKKKIKEKKSKK